MLTMKRDEGERKAENKIGVDYWFLNASVCAHIANCEWKKKTKQHKIFSCFCWKKQTHTHTHTHNETTWEARLMSEGVKSISLYIYYIYKCEAYTFKTHAHTKSTHIASDIMLFEALMHIFLQVGVVLLLFILFRVCFSRRFALVSFNCARERMVHAHTFYYYVLLFAIHLWYIVKLLLCCEEYLFSFSVSACKLIRI